MKIKVKGGVSDAGHLKTLMGVNFQTPSIEDKSGNTLQDSQQAGRFFDLCMDYMRQPNGSETYYIKNRNDKNVQAFYNDILPKLPSDVKHDITWPLQVPARDIPNWNHGRLNRIAFFNEMPMHTGNGKEFATVEDGVQALVDFCSNASGWSDLLWFHTGKPELLGRNLIGSKGEDTHREYLEQTAAMVKAGKLPNRIATTHKLNSDYSDDPFAFYTDMLQRYRNYFGDDVKVLFHEYKNKSGEMDSFEQVQLVAQFLTIMSRLKYETGNVEGGSFQCVGGPGTTNIFGLNNPQERKWVTATMYKLWEMFASVAREGVYVDSTIEDKSPNVDASVFKVDRDYCIIYSNVGNTDEHLPIPASTIEYIDSSMERKEGSFVKKLPANSVGVVWQRGIN